MIWRRKRMLENLDLDIEDHIRRETEDNIDRGMPPEEARYAALRKFGNVTQFKENTREVWSVVWLEQLLQDLHYAFRMLRKNPGFTTIVVLTLALGIGMNTAMFSVVNAVLLQPLPYPDAERLMWLTNFSLQENRDIFTANAEYVSWKTQARSFEQMAAYGNDNVAMVSGRNASQERIAFVTGDFWSITGARPALGRLFGAREANELVLSWPSYQRLFGDNPQAIGATVTLGGHPFRIVGVLRHDFPFTFPQQYVPPDEARGIDGYIPIPSGILALPNPTPRAIWEEARRRLGPSAHAVYVIGKLKSGVTHKQAETEMQTIYACLQPQRPSYELDRRLDFAPLSEKLTRSARRSLIVLLAAVAFVLLIACANIANLLLARASIRQREMAIRGTLGAGQMRVIRQLLTESILLALLGGAAGLLLARWSLAVVVQLGSGVIPRLTETKIDGQVLLFTLAISLLTGILFGLGPAISLWRANLHDTLKDDTRTSSGGVGWLRVRRLLVAVELALAIVLLTGAGLMIKSFWRMNAAPSGFEPEKILLMRVTLSGPQYEAWLQQDAYIHELFRRIETVPGVQAAGVDCGSLHTNVTVAGTSSLSPDAKTFAAVRMVSPGYLRAMGVPLLKGRWPTENEELDAFLVNESFARGIAGSGDPVGRHLESGFLKGAIIAGVVADFKYWRLDAEPSPEVYAAYALSPRVISIRVAVRTEGNSKLIALAIQKLVSEIDRTQPVYELQTLEQALSQSIAPRRFHFVLLGTFAAAAMLMALVGIYGVIAYSVTQRTKEIGIRMALGAERGAIVHMMVQQGMTIALVGIVIGLVAAFGLTRLMTSMLYNVKATDPYTFIAVAMTLALTALLACVGPALKAALIDPMVALRHE